MAIPDTDVGESWSGHKVVWKVSSPRHVKMQMLSDCGPTNRGPSTADAANGVQPKTQTIGQIAFVQMHSPMTFLGIVAPRLGYV